MIVENKREIFWANQKTNGVDTNKVIVENKREIFWANQKTDGVDTNKVIVESHFSFLSID